MLFLILQKKKFLELKKLFDSKTEKEIEFEFLKENIPKIEKEQMTNELDRLKDIFEIKESSNNNMEKNYYF